MMKNIEILIDETIDTDKLNELYFQEIEEIIQSDAFLLGTSSELSYMFQLGRRCVTCKVCPLEDYAKEIATSNEDYASPFNILNEFVSAIETPYYMVQGYGSNADGKFIRKKIGELCDPIFEFPRLKAIAASTFHHTPPMYDKDTVTHFVLNTVETHLCGIIRARALTLSKRFTPLEAVLEAYRVGLIPFGWEKGTNTLLCVNPIDI